jgi:hypothetical protein
MRKIHIAICATAALGFCLMLPEGVSAFPAADSAGKAYTQTATSKSAAVPVYFRRGYGRVGLGRGIGWRGRAIGYGRGIGWRRGWGWRGYGWRRVGWRRGWGWRRYGWRRPIGLGAGLGVAATGGYYGGSYPVTYGGCCGCGC